MRTAFTLCLASNPSGLPHRDLSHQEWTCKLLDFLFFFLIWFQHYLLFTQVWRVMQSLESAVLDLTRLLLSSPVWLSAHQLHVSGWEAQRHISTFVISEWIVIFISSMCFFFSVVDYFYRQHFCKQLSFIIVGLKKGPSGLRDQRTL